MKPSGRLRRGIARGLTLLAWLACAGLVGVFVVIYAMYADLKAPEKSFLGRALGAEVLTGAVYLRFFMPNWQNAERARFDSRLIYVPKPGRHPFRGPEFDTWVTMTADGVRLQPGPGPTDAGRDRIVITGDSYAMGWGVNDDQTFSALLQSRFGHATVNTGVSSYGTARELLRLRQMGLLEKTSLLVIQFCSNDAPENRSFIESSGVEFSSRRPESVWEDLCAATFREVSYPAVAGGAIRYLWSEFRGRGMRPLVRDLWKEPRAGARQFAATFPQLAADFLAILRHFPELATVPILVVEMNPPGDRSPFLDDLARLARDRPGLHVLRLDLRPEDYFRFDQHLRPAAHEKVAAALHRAIEEIQSAPPGAARRR